MTQRFKSASESEDAAGEVGNRKKDERDDRLGLQVFGDESAEHGDEGDGGEDRLNAVGGEPLQSFFPLRLRSRRFVRRLCFLRFDLHPEIFHLLHNLIGRDQAVIVGDA